MKRIIWCLDVFKSLFCSHDYMVTRKEYDGLDLVGIKLYCKKCEKRIWKFADV